MKDNQDKNQKSNIVKDINSVPKASNQELDDKQRSPKSGRHEGNSIQDGGQDVGSSAGSH